MRNRLTSAVSLVLLNLIFLILLLTCQPEIFAHQFDKQLINDYFLSQDIPGEVAGERVFLSDGQIHEASAYLYWKGHDPSVINFQHPPLIKYLFGLSIIVFNNVFIMQIILAFLLINITFLLSKKIFHDYRVSFLAGLLLATDPLLRLISSGALLDLGQAVFIMFYILIITQKKSTYLAGFILGLIATSKFWAGALFFVFFGFVFQLILGKVLIFSQLVKLDFWRKLNLKENIKKLFVQILIASITFCIVYLPSFIYQNGFFNIVFFELKSLKYWLNHSVTSIPFASLIMFVSGWFESWWGAGWMRTPSWNFLWPLSFFVGIFYLVTYRKKIKIINAKILIVSLPILYLFYLGLQAPFERYYIIILPFLYITLAYFIVETLKSIFVRFYELFVLEP